MLWKWEVQESTRNCGASKQTNNDKENQCQ